MTTSKGGTWERDDSGLSVAQFNAKQPYRLEPHQFGTRKGIPWSSCKSCGLLNLRNELTAWCVKMGCNASDHPEYSARCRNSRPKAVTS